jgi:ubiquinone/menaquinone biosynthesis C-methylase UbiE
VSEPAVRATYDAVARAYADQFDGELGHKPLDRALLAPLCDMTGEGVLADVGCGPGHVTRFLADRHADVVGVDLSPEMVAVARERHPDLRFMEASMLDLPVADQAWAGAACQYSIIHLTDAERSVACGELARVIRAGGSLLVAFHVDTAELSVGQVHHVSHWFDHAVSVEAHFLSPEDVTAELERAGFAVWSRTVRQPDPAIEYPSRRCYLFARRRAGDS